MFVSSSSFQCPDIEQQSLAGPHYFFFAESGFLLLAAKPSPIVLDLRCRWYVENILEILRHNKFNGWQTTELLATGCGVIQYFQITPSHLTKAFSSLFYEIIHLKISSLNERRMAPIEKWFLLRNASNPRDERVWTLTNRYRGMWIGYRSDDGEI